MDNYDSYIGLENKMLGKNENKLDQAMISLIFIKKNKV